MTEADRLSEHANVPHTLAELVVLMSNRAGYSLRAIRKEGRKQDVVDLRLKIASYARTKGFSYPEIGRALNRGHSTILQGLRKMRA